MTKTTSSKSDETEEVEEIKAPTAEEQIQDVCTHYWIIEPPIGPVSKGVCKICGSEKDFDNSL